jgi:hypothetical protein
LNCVADQTPATWIWDNPSTPAVDESDHQDDGISYSTNLFDSDEGSCPDESCSDTNPGSCYCYSSSSDDEVFHTENTNPGNCCGDDASEFYKPDYVGSECTDDVNDCVWSTGDTQASNTGNKEWWCFEHEWNECTAVAHIGTKTGNIGVPGEEVTCVGYDNSGALVGNWTGSPLTEDKYGPNACTDDYDNDGDGLIDQDDQPDCCTIINRECKVYGDDAGADEYDNDEKRKGKEKFKKIHEGFDEDEPDNNNPLRIAIRKQIQENNYYACEPNNEDIGCCTNPDSCVYDGDCYDDYRLSITKGEEYSRDLEGDGINEVCVVSSPGEWVDAGLIYGTVKDTGGVGIGGASVQVLQGTTVVYEEFTIGSGPDIGTYEIYNILYGTYSMIASADNYISSTESDRVLTSNDNIENVDFTLTLGSTCEDDCTYAGDNIIHRDCDGINGCEFCTTAPEAPEVCDLAQPGWIRDYDGTHEIECAEGCPMEKLEIVAGVTCDEENLIKTTKLVDYKGKLVKLVIVTCG